MLYKKVIWTADTLSFRQNF